MNCEHCTKVIEPDSLWMSNEAVYCSAVCRKDGKEAAFKSGANLERNGIQDWGDHHARMARLQAAADDDMDELRATPTLWMA